MSRALNAQARARLQAGGHMDHQGVTRTPRRRNCAHCGHTVLAVILDIGFTIAMETTPTTATGETAAILTGRRTYTTYGGITTIREPHLIRQWHPDKYDVYVHHQCGAPPPPANPARITPPTKERNNNQPPPF